MKAIGEITKCMEKECLLGKMAGDMLVNILKISKHFFSWMKAKIIIYLNLILFIRK